MLSEHVFIRDEIFPSWFVNLLSKFLSLGAFGFQVTKQDATHVQVVAGADSDAAIVAIAGAWRYNEATITRAHPGGGAGTYDIYVTGTATTIVNVPAPYTDTTVYSFALAITAAGVTPTIVAGVVDIYRKVGSLQWDGAQITRIDQTVPAVARHAHTHATGQADPIAPADISAAAAADLAAEITRASGAEATEVGNRVAAVAAEAAARAAADTAEATARANADTTEAAARVAGDANNPTAGEKAALAGTSGAAGGGNKYVTDADARNGNARAPTAHAASHAPAGSDPIDLSLLKVVTRETHYADTFDISSWDGTAGVIGAIGISLSAHETAQVIGIKHFCATVGATPTKYKIQWDHPGGTPLVDIGHGLSPAGGLQPAVGRYVEVDLDVPQTVADGDKLAVVQTSAGGNSLGISVGFVIERTITVSS